MKTDCCGRSILYNDGEYADRVKNGNWISLLCTMTDRHSDRLEDGNWISLLCTMTGRLADILTG